MNKTAVVLAFIVCMVVAAVAVVNVVRSQQPAQGAAQGAAQGDEFSDVDSQLRELDNFLNFENQSFYDDLSDISGDWG